KLFEPFTQADASVSRRFGGTGLGLSLSRRLCRLLGGDLVLKDSEADVGSTFIITVDITDKPDAMVRVPFASPMDMAKDKTKILSGRKFLVVDDSQDNQRIVSLFIRGVGGETDIASNGREAVQAALSNRYDVVLMDIQMPVMDGFQAMAALREKKFARPVVALTAHAMREERDRCLQAGFTEHMAKPIDRVALIEALARLSKT
ncbi:MAG: response regulator, partial [Proteobacteria bacterium]